MIISMGLQMQILVRFPYTKLAKVVMAIKRQSTGDRDQVDWALHLIQYYIYVYMVPDAYFWIQIFTNIRYYSLLLLCGQSVPRPESSIVFSHTISPPVSVVLRIPSSSLAASNIPTCLTLKSFRQTLSVRQLGIHIGYDRTFRSSLVYTCRYRTCLCLAGDGSQQVAPC